MEEINFNGIPVVFDETIQGMWLTQTTSKGELMFLDLATGIKYKLVESNGEYKYVKVEINDHTKRQS